MALATKCPHCQTTFRVAHDQLKLRAGLVRCGHCKEIFNGIEHLLPPEKPGAKSEVAPAPAVSP
ncbi:MAG TPA: MJ0042-type zinc finger domain-containing protein, partial [Oxalicibacterium sp.]|nr:MJ0042-type zinc finger domain-containing protein [Oxalicibacterium sp.]